MIKTKSPLYVLLGDKPSDESVEELSAFVVQKLEEWESGPVNVDDVLYKSEYLGTAQMLYRIFQTEKQKREEESQKQLRKEKAAGKTTLDALLREKLSMPVLTTEQIEEQLSMGARLKLVGVEQTPEPQIPEAVTQLIAQCGDKLPGFVFKDGALALAFRWWLWTCTKRVDEEMAKKDLSAEYCQALVQRKSEFPALFEPINQVIKAWGLDPKTQRADLSDLKEVRKRVEVKGGRFYWLTQAPQVETDEQKIARKQAEVKAKAVAEANQKQRDELKGNLKARLLETDSGQTADETPEQKTAREGLAETMAARLAKKYCELSDITAIFRAAAINRMASAKGNEFEEQTAKRYAKAACMTDEELEIAVNAHHQMHADEARAKTDQDAKKKRQSPGYGAEKPETANASKKKKKGGGDNNKGHQGRTNNQ